MNYLGHIFFSNNDPALMYANLFGDFVKGKDLTQYAVEVQKGIVLHRTIDSFIDNHKSVKELAHLLAIDLPKVAPIAIDIYFDHFLVKHWNVFSKIDLEGFLDTFYDYSFDKSKFQHPLFLQMIERMREHQWLIQYRDIKGVERSCLSVANRLSFENALVHGAQVLVKHYEDVEEAFFQYMKDAIPYFESYHLNNR